MNRINININQDNQGRVYSDIVPESFAVKDQRDPNTYLKDPAQLARARQHPKMIPLYYHDKENNRYYLPRGWYGNPKEPRQTTITWAPLCELDKIADQLYDYQYNAVEAMIESIKTTNWWLIVSDTGTWKTRMIRALTMAMWRPIVFVTPNITIQKNAVNSFSERWLELIPINWKQDNIDPNKSYACHYSTLELNYDALNDWKRLLICDEAHMCPCDTLLKAICLWRCDEPETCVFWVTATPYRTEFWTEWFEKIFWTIYYTWAKALPLKVLRFKQKREYSIDYMLECKWDLPSDSPMIYRNMLNKDKERTQWIIDMALKCYNKDKNWKVIVFCDRVEAAENLYTEIKSKIWQDVLLHIGKTSKQDLQKSLENKNQYVIVWTVGCCWEWLDIPSLTTWILTFNTSNQKSIAQMAWRMRRNCWDKKCWYLIDMADIIKVWWGKAYYGWASQRAKIYWDLGFDLQDFTS